MTPSGGPPAAGRHFVIVCLCPDGVGEATAVYTLLSILGQEGGFTLDCRMWAGPRVLERLEPWRDAVDRRTFSPTCRGVRLTLGRLPAGGIAFAQAVGTGTATDMLGCLEPGDRLVPGALETVARLLDEADHPPGPAGGLAWVCGPPTAVAADGLPGPDNSPAAFAAATLWRRDTWEAAGRLSPGPALWQQLATVTELVEMDRPTGLAAQAGSAAASYPDAVPRPHWTACVTGEEPGMVWTLTCALPSS